MNSHLGRFIAGRDQINLCLDTLQFYASFVEYKMHCEMTSTNCKLHNYLFNALL